MLLTSLPGRLNESFVLLQISMLCSNNGWNLNLHCCARSTSSICCSKCIEPILIKFSKNQNKYVVNALVKYHRNRANRACCFLCLRKTVITFGQECTFLERWFYLEKVISSVHQSIQACTHTIIWRWRHNDHDGVSNHQPHDCLLNHLSRHRWKKHQSSASLAFVRGIHRWPVNSPHKGPVTRKMGPFDDVIMIEALSLETRKCRSDHFVVTACTAGCHNNLLCHQWRQSCQHDSSRFSLCSRSMAQH